MLNIGVTELVVVFAILAVPAVILVIALSTRGAGLSSERHHSALVHDATPEAFIQRAAAAVAGLPKHTIGGVGTATLVVTRGYFKTWRVVVAVLFFPVGLIAVLNRDHDTATVSAAMDSGHVRVTLDGAFSAELVDRLNTVLD